MMRLQLIIAVVTMASLLSIAVCTGVASVELMMIRRWIERNSK